MVWLTMLISWPEAEDKSLIDNSTQESSGFNHELSKVDNFTKEPAGVVSESDLQSTIEDRSGLQPSFGSGSRRLSDVKENNFSLYLSGFPDVLSAGEENEIAWRIKNDSLTIENGQPIETRLYWSTDSVKIAQEGAYRDSSDLLSGKIDARYSAKVKTLVTGNYYFRAYAKIDGHDYWSEEVRIDAK